MTLMELSSHVRRAGSAILHARAGNVRNVQPAQTVSSLTRWAERNGLVAFSQLNAGNGSVFIAVRK